MSTLYDTDYQAWLHDQADALREAARLRLNLPFAIDWERIAEELEGMSRSERRELRSRSAVLLLHLLKWQIQKDHRCRSWELTIAHQRKEIVAHLMDSPGLKSKQDEILMQAYADARVGANFETGLPLSDFPDACPFTMQEILDPDFWPE
jgi:hypothetical protein